MTNRLDERRAGSEERELLVQGAPRSRKNAVRGRVFHQHDDAHRQEAAHAERASRGDAFGCFQTLSPRDEGNDLYSADALALASDVSAGTGVDGEVLDLVEPSKTESVELDHAAVSRDQRVRTRRGSVDGDSFAGE